MKLTIKKQLKNFWVILDGEQKREFLILLPLITAGAMLEALPTFIGNLQGAWALEITQEWENEFQIGTK